MTHSPDHTSETIVTTDTVVERRGMENEGRFAPHRRDQPAFTPLDLVAGALILVMIGGPLAAGAFGH